MQRGRFADAEQAFLRAPKPASGDLDPAFLRALALRWRLLYDNDVPELRRRFEDAIQALLARAEERSGAEADRLAGTAWLLRAEAVAHWGQPLRAGRDARRGKRALERARRADPCDGETYFALGAYNYFADRVSALLKGVRALLFIPGGDAPLGIRQLAVAADRARATRLEAHLLLAAILASSEEQRFEEALGHARAARALAPRSPAAVVALGEILDAMGREREAQGLLEPFLRETGKLDFDHAEDVRAVAGLRLARIRIRRLDLGAADALLTSLNGGGKREGSSPQRRARAEQLSLLWALDEGARGTELAANWGLPWPPAGSHPCDRGSLRGLETPPGRLSGLAATPDGVAGGTAVVEGCVEGSSAYRELALGRALLRAGDPLRATAHLRVAASGRVDADVAGWARLHLGEIEAGRGRQAEARRWLTAAAETRGFRDRLRAWYDLTVLPPATRSQ